MLETLTYKNKWLVKEEYEDQYSKSVTTYRLELFSKYYKNIDELDDSYFVVDMQQIITNLSNNEDTYTTMHTKILNDTEFVIYRTTNDINTVIKYNGRPSLANRKYQ